VKRIFFTAALLGSSILSTFISAQDIRHTYGDSAHNSFYIDNKGGSIQNGGHDLSYYLNFEEVDQSARGTLLLYGQSASLGARVDNGYLDDDFSPSTGIQIYPLSNLLGGSFDGEIGLASNAPFTPVGFSGTQTGLQVEQASYTSHEPGNPFVILEYRVINPGAQSSQVLLGIANDFDVDLKDKDASAGFSAANGIPLVYQQEAPPNSASYTTVGLALLAGSLEAYRIEECDLPFPYCAIFAADNDAVRLAFFTGDASQTNDLTQGGSSLDFATTLAADLGSLAPNRGANAVFCYVIGQGASAADALADIEGQALSCKAFYQSNLQICQNSLVNFGEECDDGNASNQDSCTNACHLPVCGDGFVQAVNNELCDNGNLNSNSAPNACRSNCQPAHCGDGVADAGEECDDGDADNKDACTNSCQNAKCGDGFVQRGRGEFCDDGNNANGDGCSADCLSFESCGNGSVDPGEACDDGNSITSDACPSGSHGTCQAAFCGDGFLRVGIEDCDDGNNFDGDGCAADCHSEAAPAITPPPSSVCGNGIVEAGEECDDGNDIETDACATNCRPLGLQGGSSTPLNGEGGGSGGCSFLPAPSFPGISGFSFGALFLYSAGLCILLRERAKASDGK